MRILVHDYAGHPFQAQLSRALAQRGHTVTHSSCRAYVSGKGNFESDSPNLNFATVGGAQVAKSQFVRRAFQEVGYGVALARQIHKLRPDIALVANAPIPTLVVMAMLCRILGVPWTLWHQDVQAVALEKFAATKLQSPVWRVLARVMPVLERWCAHQAAAVVVIADGFLSVHEQWGTADKTQVIPNWAPLDEIVPVARDNAWAHEHELVGVPTLVYSGTLGLKHNPKLLVDLAAAVRERGLPARLVVVNEGVAVDVVREAAAQADVPLLSLPFQPYERLPEVLGSGDALVVLLEKSAGEFSVPSKTLSYLCAGRPTLGLMPAENLAARLLTESGCAVFDPDDEAIPAAADWLVQTLGNEAKATQLQSDTRQLAEREFALDVCADKFERLLESTVHDMDMSLK